MGGVSCINRKFMQRYGVIIKCSLLINIDGGAVDLDSTRSKYSTLLKENALELIFILRSFNRSMRLFQKKIWIKKLLAYPRSCNNTPHIELYFQYEMCSQINSLDI